MDGGTSRATNLKEKINERWRMNLFKTCALLAVIGFVTEVVIYLIDANTRTLFLPYRLYRHRFIYIPSTLNLLVMMVTYNRINSRKLTDNQKNVWSCILIYYLCANIQFIHYVYGPLLALPCIAVLVTIIFGNRTLTMGITLASLVSLCAAGLVASMELRKGDPQLYSDVFLAGLVIVVAEIAASFMIAYVNEQFDSLEQSNKREKELIKELHVDPLMGIYNRMALGEKIEECITLDQTDGTCHMLMMDIDDFKGINDTYGHLNGDDVLIQLSDTIRTFTKRNINAYRYGGEELVIIAQHLSLEETYELAENLRKAFAKSRYDFAPEKAVTFSGGIATLMVDETADEWIAQADEALYEAKRRGKNCIVKQQYGRIA